MKIADSTPPIVVALDFSDAATALALVDKIEPSACRLKVGKELFCAAGPALVENLVARGFDVFLDLKFHDIPQTVAKACQAAAKLGVWMINVHALGGRRMMMAAREALDATTIVKQPLLIAVTVLTSSDASDLASVGITHSPAEMVDRLADLAQQCRLDGIVCSANEAGAIRARYGDDFVRVTPGIRLQDDAAQDQKRVATPQAAMANGASYLVIGRPITLAVDPLAKLRQIANELGY